MPAKSRETLIGERLSQRMSKLANKIKENSAAPFGVTQYSQAEFRKKAREDKNFRMAMAEKMGPQVFLEAMNGDRDGQLNAG